MNISAATPLTFQRLKVGGLIKFKNNKAATTTKVVGNQ